MILNIIKYKISIFKNGRNIKYIYKNIYERNVLYKDV